MARAPTEYTPILNTLSDAAATLKKSSGDPVKVLKDVTAYIGVARDTLGKIVEPPKSDPAHAEYTNARDSIEGLERSTLEYTKMATMGQYLCAERLVGKASKGVKTEIDKRFAPYWAIKNAGSAIQSAYTGIDSAKKQADDILLLVGKLPDSGQKDETRDYGKRMLNEIMSLEGRVKSVEQRHSDWTLEYEKRQRSEKWVELQKKVRKLRF